MTGSGELDLQRHPRSLWWKADGDTLHSDIWAAVEHLDQINQQERSANLHYLRLYSNRAVQGYTTADFIGGQDGGERVKMNVIKSCIDAATSFIATNRPRPFYVPEGGKNGWQNKQTAEAQAKYVTGIFHTEHQYIKSLSTFRDGGIWGSGWQNVFPDKNEVCIERVMDDEVVLDPRDSYYGAPTFMFRVKDIERSVLLGTYPKKYHEDIRAATKMRHEGDNNFTLADPVTVIEAWKLPTSRHNKDGRHCITLETATLKDEKWSRLGFQLANWNWNDSPVGYRGVGIAEELTSIQIEINYIAQKIQRLMTLATSTVWTERGSGIGDITNKDWGQRAYRGKPPIFQTTAAVSAEYFTHLDRLYQRAFEIVGISQLQAQSKKPAGLDSGAALRVYNDIGTRRFQHTGQRWEHYHVVEIAERILEASRQIRERGGTPNVLFADKEFAERIEFAKACLPSGKYQVRVHPTSILPDTPSGKIETMERIGQISPRNMQPYIAEMMGQLPDFEMVVERINAPTKIAEKMVGHILTDGDYEPPFAGMDLNVARDIGTKELMRAKIHGVPEERIEGLRRWLMNVDEMQAKAEKAQMEMMGGVGVSQPGAPVPQPTPDNPMAGSAPAAPDMLTPPSL